MSNPNTIEEAREASEELINNEQLSLEEVPTVEKNSQIPGNLENPEQSINNTDVSEEQTLIQDATNTADAAAQLAANKDAQLQQLMQELEEEKQNSARLQGTIDELSRKNEENIIEKTLTPPEIDFNALAFAEPEVLKAAQAKYAEDMSAYNRKLIMEELQPYIEQAKVGMLQKEKDEIITDLSNLEQFAGIKDMIPQIERIIEKNPALSAEDVPLADKIITAYLMAEGVNAKNTPPLEHKEPTSEDFMKMYESNPELQEMVEKVRINKLKESTSQQVPPLSASSGAGNAALNIPKKTKTLDDALERTKELFRLN